MRVLSHVLLLSWSLSFMRQTKCKSEGLTIQLIYSEWWLKKLLQTTELESPIHIQIQPFHNYLLNIWLRISQRTRNELYFSLLKNWDLRVIERKENNVFQWYKLAFNNPVHSGKVMTFSKFFDFLPWDF